MAQTIQDIVSCRRSTRLGFCLSSMGASRRSRYQGQAGGLRPSRTFSDKSTHGSTRPVHRRECGNLRSLITPATKDANTVIPAEAGIQDRTGCRIKSGMTPIDMFTCRSNNERRGSGSAQAGKLSGSERSMHRQCRQGALAIEAGNSSDEGLWSLQMLRREIHAQERRC